MLQYLNKNKFYLFTIIIVSSMFFNNTYITVLLLVVGILITPEIIYPLLLISPLIEIRAVLADGFTITKLLVIIYFFYFYLKRVKLKKIKFNRDMKVCFMGMGLFLIIVIIGFFRAINLVELINTIKGYSISYNQIILFNLAKISKIILSLCLIIDFSNRSLEDVKRLFKKIAISVSLALAAISLYTLTIGKVSWQGYKITRVFLKGTDPNEFSAIIASLLAFTLYMFISSKNKFPYLLNYALAVFVIVATLSRTGSITILLIVVLSVLLISDHWKKILIYGAIIGLITILIFSLEVQQVITRFTVSNGDINRLTAGRTDIWIAGVRYTLSRALLFGSGGTMAIERYISYLYYETPKVMHNLFISLFVQYGLTGLLVFLSIIAYTLISFVRLRYLFSKKEYKIYLISFISLLGILFAGLALEWAFAEVLWILLGISIGVVHSLKNNIATNNEIEYDNLGGVNG